MIQFNRNPLYAHGGAALKSFLKALVLVPLAVVVVLLALANRSVVMVSFDPFSSDAPAFSLTMPLFVLIFATVALGVIIGGVASWLMQGRHRRAARDSRREATKLRGESEQLKAALAARSPALRS